MAEGTSEYRLDVKHPRLSVPADIQTRLAGRNEVKIYEVGDPVFQWTASVPDVFDSDDAVAHPFLNALKYELCYDTPFHEGVVSGAFRGVKNDPRAAFFAFDDDGMIVGFSVVSTSPMYPDDLMREVTCAGIRKKGWGTRMDSAIVNYARRMGKRRVRLYPTEDAKPIHFAMGFRVDPEHPSFLIKDVPPAGGRRKTRRRGKRSFRSKNKQWTRRL